MTSNLTVHLSVDIYPAILRSYAKYIKISTMFFDFLKYEAYSTVGGYFDSSVVISCCPMFSGASVRCRWFSQLAHGRRIIADNILQNLDKSFKGWDK